MTEKKKKQTNNEQNNQHANMNQKNEEKEVMKNKQNKDMEKQQENILKKHPSQSPGAWYLLENQTKQKDDGGNFLKKALGVAGVILSAALAIAVVMSADRLKNIHFDFGGFASFDADFD